MGEALAFNPEEESTRFRARRQRANVGSAPAPAEGVRVLPHSIEAEEFLLSCCLLDGAEAVARCLVARIRPESFYDPKHGIIFGAVLPLFGTSAPIDTATVAEELKGSGRLEAAGGFAMLV